MNILVLSDSHGRMANIKEAFARQVKRPDAVVFLGDGLRDLSYCDIGGIPLFAVNGNCDVYDLFGTLSPSDEIVMTLGGKRFLMVHGHAYGVKNGLGRLIAHAVEKDVDVALFGHTHVPLEKYLPEGESEYGILLKKPLYLLNPGSIGGFSPSFGCVTVNERGGVILSHGTLA